MSDGRRRPGWFVAAKATLGPEIAVRNQLTKAYGANPGNDAKKALKAARKRVKRAIVLAKESWMELVVDTINGKESADDRRPVTPQDIWKAIQELERGPRTAKELKPFALRKDQTAGGAAVIDRMVLDGVVVRDAERCKRCVRIESSPWLER